MRIRKILFMNLLNNTRKVFITETAWLALLDTEHEFHLIIKEKFKEILDQQFKIITSSYVIDNVLESLKNDYNSDLAKKFLDIIDKSALSNHLKIFWLNRRLRRKAIESFLDGDFIKLSRALNIVLIRQKKVHSILTPHLELYEQYNLPCFNLNTESKSA